MTQKIKLTKGQREVILAMRKEEGIFRWLKGTTKFTFRGKTFRYKLGCELAYYSGLLTPKERNIRVTIYTLTDLGKTIEL